MAALRPRENATRPVDNGLQYAAGPSGPEPQHIGMVAIAHSPALRAESFSGHPFGFDFRNSIEPPSTRNRPRWKYLVPIRVPKPIPTGISGREHRRGALGCGRWATLLRWTTHFALPSIRPDGGLPRSSGSLCADRSSSAGRVRADLPSGRQGSLRCSPSDRDGSTKTFPALSRRSAQAAG